MGDWRAADQAERHLISVGSGEGLVKIALVQFHTDGSIFVHFPYHPDVAGIAARCELPAGEQHTYHLADFGKITSHKVKYSHHPDGYCLFSQDGKVVSAVRNRSAPLDADPGHIFSIDVQGLSQFREMSPERDYYAGRYGRGLFDFQADRFPARVHIVAFWKRLKSDVKKAEIASPSRNNLGMGARDYIVFLPPDRFPIGDHALFVDLVEELDAPLDPNAEFLLLFSGGFGLTMMDLNAPTDLLQLKYPAGDETDLPSIDLGDQMSIRLATDHGL